jgi:stage II sporulation protein D
VLLVGLLVPSSGFGIPQPGTRNPASGTVNPEPALRIGVAKPGGGYAIETMPLETYVARVVAGEALRNSQPAALEALAITVRTFALANRGRHRADNFDLCDQTHCQVVRTATAATERAAQATAGRLLLHGGAPASIFYTASCGGRTEIPSAVWPGAEDPPFLPSREDEACEGAPEWSAELRDADLMRALRAAGFRGERLRDVRIIVRSGSGRVARIGLDGLRPDQISGQDLRVAVGRTLGWQHIKSTAFDVRRAGDRFRFTGHGSGHGVGLCVIGSARLAERGETPEAILARYFPGLQLSGVEVAVGVGAGVGVGVGVGVDVVLPDEDEGQRAAIVRRALRARDEMAKALGVAAPARITVRFHPTIDDYARATAQPWFTSGAIVDGELHLPPLTELRDRGVLDRAMRHELVHLMTDGLLATRPLWVREGAASYFSDRDIALPAAVRAPCPDDNELRRPVSAGALANAYARARACFARQVEQGRTWKDVR